MLYESLLTSDSSKTPFILQWLITRKCNLNCKHCYLSSSNSNEMTTKQGLDLINNFSQFVKLNNLNGCIIFSGGEPLLRKDIFHFLEVSSKNNLITYVLTNGLLLNQKNVSKLEKVNLKSIQVSLEGCQQSTHEMIRGKNTFEKTLKSIKLLTRTKIRTIVTMTIGKHNIDEVQDFIDLAHNLGCSGVGFHRLLPLGKGANIKSATLSPDNLKTLFTKLEEAKKIYRKFEICNNDPLLTLIKEDKNKKDKNLVRGGCIAGFGCLAVDANGDVFPCPRLPIIIGNVLSDSIEKIFVESKVLNRLRNRNLLKGKCGKCLLKLSCGGCRAAAFGEYGDMMREDPGCWRQ
jgi:radical SAM protein with 4Fe4S-binding SPASM domain